MTGVVKGGAEPKSSTVPDTPVDARRPPHLRFVRGVAFAFLLAVPFWVGVAALVVMLLR